MAETTVEVVAKWFVFYAQEHGDLITNLKLQKLTYYAQAWHLGLYNEPLFDDEVQAWVHGPVIPAVYHQFKDFQWNPISIQPENLSLSNHLFEHLKETYGVYGGFDAYQLELMTHQELPWLNARQGLDIDDYCSREINPEDMKQFCINAMQAS